MSSKISFQSLSVDDKYNVLEQAADRSDGDPYLLEKDIWVVQILKILFDAPFAVKLFREADEGILRRNSTVLTRVI